MGYLTKYDLTTTPELILPLHVQEYLGCDEWGDFEGERKWYDHEECMLDISKDYPLILFTLKGIGEEHGDCWIKYFKNGKMITAGSQIVYEKVDLTQLD